MMAAALALAVLLHAAWPQSPQEVATATQEATPASVNRAIDQLGSLDYGVRTQASRDVRRAPAAIAVPALIEAAASHQDSYARFRALVLLAGFNDPRADVLMQQLLADPNDRVRGVAYAWFEYRPAPVATAHMLGALEAEASEFVRPALTRTLAAQQGAEVRAAITPLVTRGQDFFRGAVIEALGDYKALYAADAIAEVAKLDGPLQDDAVLALGKIGERRYLPLLAELQRTAPDERQPAIAAAICLLGAGCPAHERYLGDALRFAIDNPEYQPLLRSAATALATLAIAGRTGALDTLVAAGLPSRDPARAAIALALGTVALRSPDGLVDWMAAHQDAPAVAELLREAFDMLEEDFEEERFFVSVRRRYWQAGDGTAVRTAAETLIRTLEF